MNRHLSRFAGLPVQMVVSHRSPSAWRGFLHRYRENLRLERAPVEEQRARQLLMLRELLAYAGEKVPWYRRLFRENGFRPELVDSIERLRELPPLTKEDIQDNLPDLAPPGGALGSFLNSTGGSTGLPLNFYQGRRYVSESAPNAWVSDGAAGRRLGDRTCVLWAAKRDIPLPGRLRNRFWNTLINRRFLNAYAMSAESMEGFATLIEKFRPRVLIGYAESLDIFARFLLTRGGAAFTFPGVSVISTAGMLYPDMRESIEEAFGVPVLDRYGCREVGLLAYECVRYSGHHLNVFNQVVELEEPESSEPSPVLATNLSNYSMPFIRYRTGDLALPSDGSPCPCGRTSPRFSRLVGRMTDTVTTAEGTMIYGAYFRHVLFGVQGLRRFQFIQESPQRYRLLLETTSIFNIDELTGIRKRILDAVGAGSELEIGLVDGIEPSPSGKHLFVISKVPVGRSQSARER